MHDWICETPAGVGLAGGGKKSSIGMERKDNLVNYNGHIDTYVVATFHHVADAYRRGGKIWLLSPFLYIWDREGSWLFFSE